MAQALPLTSIISATSTSTTSYRTIKISFGNGYEQRTTDGINTKVARWSISYTNINSTDRATIWSFLDTVKGTEVITWTPPGGTSAKFVLDGDVSEQAVSGNLYSISFPIRQVYDLT